MNNQNNNNDNIYQNYQTNIPNNQTNNINAKNNQIYNNVNYGNNKGKKILKVIMIVTLVLILISVGGFVLVYTGIIKIGYVEPKSILLNTSNIGVKKNSSYQYDYQVYPESTTTKNVYYESSNPSVADVNPVTGYVTPKKEGSVVISVKSSEDDTIVEKSNLSVTKDKVAIEDIKLSSNRIIFDLSNKSKSQLIKVLTEPYNATSQDLSFKSSDENVAIVDQSGRVYPVGFGMATILVRSKDGNASTTCDVIVTDSKNKKVYFELPDNTKLVFPYSIQLDTNYLKLKYGTSRKVGFKLLPPDVTEDVVTWISSDPNVAIVNDGVIFGNAIGSTTIIARTVNDLAATLTVDVTNEETTANNVKFLSDTEKIEIGETKKLAVSYDANATIANFRWSSSNPNIIKVDGEGNITALEKGNSVITVTPTSGNANGDTILVISSGIATPNYLIVKETDITIGTGETRKIEVESDTGNDKFIYQSMNEEIATINENGIIYGAKVGETMIKISAANGVSTNVKVKVTNVEASKITITASKTTLKKGESLDLKVDVWPKNVTEKSIKWKSSNTNVVSVNDVGVISAKSLGQATITATIGSQSNSIIIKVANESSSNEPTEPTNILSDAEIESLKKTPIIFEKVDSTKIKITLDLENQGYSNYVDKTKTTFSIVSSGVDQTIKDLKIKDINGMPNSKYLTFASASYGKITIKASVYLTGNKKQIDIQNATYEIGNDISVEFSIPLEGRLSLANYFSVKEAKNVTDWVVTDSNIATISNGYISGIKVGSTTIKGHSNGYTFTAKINVVDNEGEVSNESYTFIYDTCYSPSDLCKVGNLQSTTLVKDTKKCSNEKPYYVDKQKFNYEFVCKDATKKIIYKGISTTQTTDKNLEFDWANGASVYKGQKVTIKIKNWQVLNLKNASVLNSLDNKTTTISEKDSFQITIPTNTNAKNVVLTVTAKTNNNETYKKSLIINISDDFVPGNLECEIKNELSIINGEEKNLSCTLIGKYDASLRQPLTSSENPTYKSSNSNIVSIDNNGKIIAKKVGTAKITVTVGNLNAVTVNVTVKEGKPIYKTLTISIKDDKKDVKTVELTDENLKLSYVLKSADGKTTTSGENVTFTSSNNNIITITDGDRIVPVAPGTAVINGVYTNRDASVVKGEFKVTIAEKTPNITSLDCTEELPLVLSSNTGIISCKAYDKANNRYINLSEEPKYFTFSSSDTKIATVDKNGKVTPIKVGTANITVSAGNNLKKTIKVNVKSEKPKYDKIEITTTETELAVGNTITIKYKLIGSNGEATYDPAVNMQIQSGEKYAQIQNDKVTIKGINQGNVVLKLAYKNPNDGSILSATTTISVYNLLTCYRYKETITNSESCPNGYGFNGSNTINCYKIIKDVNTERACLYKDNTPIKLRIWSNGQCLDAGDTKLANVKTTLGEYIYGNDKETQGKKDREQVNNCHGACTADKCSFDDTQSKPEPQPSTPSTNNNLATSVIKETMGKTGGIIGVTNESEKTTDKNASNIREYRYSGANVNNYVMFNDELWRIVGIFKDENGNEHIKIVRGNVGGDRKWDSTNNDWTNSDLKDYLNKTYYNSLSTNAKEMITETKYYLGAVNFVSSAKSAYINERDVASCKDNTGNSPTEKGCRVWKGYKATWTGNIAPLYLSDYGFSLDSSYWKNIDSNIKEAMNTSWIYNDFSHNNYEWLLPPDDINKTNVASWSAMYGFKSRGINTYGSVHASLYLKSTINITIGDGSKLHPYVLGTENGNSSSPTIPNIQPTTGIATTVLKETMGKSNGIIGVTKQNKKTTDKNANDIREYRYSGVNADNYVYFNCEDGKVQNSDNCEKWRIIGIFKDENGNEHLKIIRNDSLSKDMIPDTYTENSKKYNIKDNRDKSFTNYAYCGSNNWATAGLQYWLNAGSDKETKTASDGYMSYLSKNAKNMIEEQTKYYLGTLTYHSSNKEFGIKETTNEAYAHERDVASCKNNTGSSATASGCRVWSGKKATWNGKITLLYPSDYGYSADSQYWNTRLSNFGDLPSHSSWLFKSIDFKPETTISPSTRSSSSCTVAMASGFLYADPSGTSSSTIHPALELKSQIKISAGDGSKQDCYQLSVE